MELEGWQGQFRRVERWAQRLAELGGPRLGELRDEDIDIFWAFCTSAYHLGDWLQNNSAATKTDLGLTPGLVAR